MELMVDNIIEPLKQSSTFAENLRLKLIPDGMSFFIFELSLKI